MENPATILNTVPDLPACLSLYHQHIVAVLNRRPLFFSSLEEKGFCGPVNEIEQVMPGRDKIDKEDLVPAPHEGTCLQAYN